MEFTYFAFTRMPGESYSKILRPLLLLSLLLLLLLLLLLCVCVCVCVCVTSFECQLTPLCADSLIC